MPPRSGINAQVGYGLETTPGVPVVPTAFVPLTSEGLGQERGRLESAGIIPGRRVLSSTMTNGGDITAGGDVAHELYNRGLGKLLTAMFGTGVTTGPTAGRYTHTFTPGEPLPLTVQKGVPDVGTGTVHPFTYSGMMVESWEIACSAGEIATIGVTFAGMREYGVRTVTDGATTSGSAAITSVTAAWNADDVGKPISGAGIPAAATIASVTSATAATLSANATATATGVTFTVGIPLATPSYPSDIRPYKYTHASVSMGGTAVKVKQLTVSGNNGLATDRRFLGSGYRDQPLEADLHTYDGSIDVEFTNRTQYDRFISGADFPVVVGFANGVGDTFGLNLNVRVDGETPKVGGRDIVGQSLPFKAVGTTDAAAITAVVVNADVTP